MVLLCSCLPADIIFADYISGLTDMQALFVFSDIKNILCCTNNHFDPAAIAFNSKETLEPASRPSFIILIAELPFPPGNFPSMNHHRDEHQGHKYNCERGYPQH